MLAPIAKRGGTPRARVRIGTIITPPPRPSSEPSAPASKEASRTIKKNMIGSISTTSELAPVDTDGP